MMKSLKKILMAELIGKKVEVIEASTPVKGIKGTIINETKHIITIKTTKGNKMVQKNQATFRIWAKEGPVDVEGKLLEQRPEDRTKNG